jgi:hypothetical protein
MPFHSGDYDEGIITGSEGFIEPKFSFPGSPQVKHETDIPEIIPN